jgi:hypothetical protein
VAITDKYRLEGGETESLDFADFVRRRSTPMQRTAWLLTGSPANWTTNPFVG